MSVRSIAERAAHTLGAADLIRYRNKSRVRILMYHRFNNDLSRLAAQCEHLSRYYHCITLNELAQAAKNRSPLPPNSLAITIDDGYRDFLHAFPLFQRFGLKVTLYVVSGFAAQEIWLWPDQVLHLFESTHVRTAEIPVPGGTVKLDLTNPIAAFEPFAQRMIAMKNVDRLAVIKKLPALLESELPVAAPERFEALSWVELKSLASQGLDIGAHSATHPILSKLETGLKEEIAGSKARIEAETGFDVLHFCYPNGTDADISLEAIEMVKRSGFNTAVVAEPGYAGPPFSLFELKRLGVGPELQQAYFERYVAGYRV
jgi:peptidoglycan/xylan/chitin deacetylase (PgdA/CDA1 family)